MDIDLFEGSDILQEATDLESKYVHTRTHTIIIPNEIHIKSLRPCHCKC